MPDAAIDLRRSRLAPVVALVLGAVVVSLARWGPDWPAQEYRAWLAAHDGLIAWSNHWYSGEALPGYSALYPAFGALLGAPLTGLLAVGACAWAAATFAPRNRAPATIAYHLATALCLLESLVIGQVTFLLGLAFALWALIDLRTGHRHRAAVLALGSALGSPLAGAFLLMSVPAVGRELGWRRSAPLLAAAPGVLALAVVGGAGGPFPFPFEALLAQLAFCALPFVVTPKRVRGLRWFAACYALTALVAFFVPDPVGGNVVRLAKLIALPLALLVLARGETRPERRRRVLLALAMVGAVAWPSVPFATSVSGGAGDPSQRQTYFSGLISYLDSQPSARAGRLEIPFTRGHWEAMWVAQAFPLARGWERQTDLAYNQVLYHPLTAASYRRWLDDNAVTFVALPRVPIDYGGQAEATLLRHPPAYLQPVYQDANWRVWRVQDPGPLVTGPATVRDFESASLELHFRRAGTAVVKVHSSRLWGVTAGVACETATPTGWLQVTSAGPGPVTLHASVGTGMLSSRPHCHGVTTD